MSARLSDYDYELPRELIAQRPPEHRDDSRLMVLRRDSQGIEHRQFDELKTFLQQGDLLVLNDTQVLSARRFSDDGAVEFLFLERLAPCRWKCLVSPGRKMRIGATVRIDNVTLCVDKITPEGERIVVLNKDIDLYSGGSMPLPHANRHSPTSLYRLDLETMNSQLLLTQSGSLVEWHLSTDYLGDRVAFRSADNLTGQNGLLADQVFYMTVSEPDGWVLMSLGVAMIGWIGFQSRRIAMRNLDVAHT